MRRPSVLPGYDPSSEMGPKNHTTITVPTREARTCLHIRLLLISELAVLPGGITVEKFQELRINFLLQNSRRSPKPPESGLCRMRRDRAHRVTPIRQAGRGWVVGTDQR
ncbi:hypothetical protein AVEN_39128-1 [Araneus ventricosus]|uniref:Uncharacterized protein n=1 Tax=Araneus ventricosus TaxID=182803 RepID=A0A4Y2LID9_ARAVE|nr:hypothetical protein AVEN_39128-1 [Araneus ventricosus]